MTIEHIVINIMSHKTQNNHLDKDRQFHKEQQQHVYFWCLSNEFVTKERSGYTTTSGTKDYNISFIPD